MKCLIFDHNKGIWGKMWHFSCEPRPINCLCLCVSHCLRIVYVVHCSMINDILGPVMIHSDFWRKNAKHCTNDSQNNGHHLLLQWQDDYWQRFVWFMIVHIHVFFIRSFPDVPRFISSSQWLSDDLRKCWWWSCLRKNDQQTITSSSGLKNSCQKWWWWWGSPQNIKLI